MKLSRVKFLLIIFLFQSCQHTSTFRLVGDWREFYNDSIVADYSFARDTIKYKYCASNWVNKLPYFVKDSRYFCKDKKSYFFDNDPLIFQIISITDSSNIIIKVHKKVTRLKKLVVFNNELPNSVMFDMVDYESNEIVDRKYNLGNGDYFFQSDGKFKFCLGNKLHEGILSDTLLKEFKVNYNLVDTLDKRITEHYFEMHGNKKKYKVSFRFRQQVEQFDINDKQPLQFNRLSVTLEKILYEVSSKSGYSMK